MKYKNLYDELYKNGYHDNYNLCHTRRLFNHVNENFDKNDKILDIGCSHGTAVKLLNEMGFDSYGVDISSVAIEMCNKRNIKNCKVSSASNLDFEDSYFDGIVSSDTFEHLDPEEIPSAVSECNRVLKPGGIAILNIALRPEVNRKYDYIANKFGLQNLHTSVLSAEQWEVELVNKFSILEVKGATFLIKK
tara:strand:- start:548 stop:1120 length:573 start_codon:yes stop_codon:yes gene_type:complete